MNSLLATITYVQLLRCKSANNRPALRVPQKAVHAAHYARGCTSTAEGRESLPSLSDLSLVSGNVGHKLYVLENWEVVRAYLSVA